MRFGPPPNSRGDDGHGSDSMGPPGRWRRAGTESGHHGPSRLHQNMTPLAGCSGSSGGTGSSEQVWRSANRLNLVRSVDGPGTPRCACPAQWDALRPPALSFGLSAEVGREGPDLSESAAGTWRSVGPGAVVAHTRW